MAEEARLPQSQSDVTGWSVINIGYGAIGRESHEEAAAAEHDGQRT